MNDDSEVIIIDGQRYMLSTWMVVPGRLCYEVKDAAGNTVALCRRWEGVRDPYSCARAAIRRQHKRAERVVREGAASTWR